MTVLGASLARGGTIGENGIVVLVVGATVVGGSVAGGAVVAAGWRGGRGGRATVVRGAERAVAVVVAGAG